MQHPADHITRILDLMQMNWPSVSVDQAGMVIAAQRLARLFEGIASEVLLPMGLSAHEFELLAALRAHPAPHRLTPTELYEAMLISSGGLTKMLKGLEARGLIHRSVSETDRRSRPVELTKVGRDLVSRAMSAVQKAEAPIFEAMRDEQGSVRELTSRLIGLAGAAERTDLRHTG